MAESLIGHLVEPLRWRLHDWAGTAVAHAERSGERLAISSCDLVPAEVLAAFGVRMLRVPSQILRTESCTIDLSDGFDSLLAADPFVISPSCCRIIRERHLPVIFDVPRGWGEEAAENLHYGLDALVRSMGFDGINSIDVQRLSGAVEEYNAVRRIIRGIAEYRAGKPALMSNTDLLTLFDAAVCLPPEMTLPHLALCLEAASSDKTAASARGPRIMVSGGHLSDWGGMDLVEAAGSIIAEDDLCNGRRQFDQSHNPTSQYLYYEIINACSFRPYCPVLRNVRERYELVYRLLGNYDIQMVLLLTDTAGGYTGEDLEWLRVRLMRLGIDPIVTDQVTAADRIAEHIRAVGL